MKTVLFCLVLLMGMQTSAQERDSIFYNPTEKIPEQKTEELESQKKEIEEEERNQLREEVKKINQELEEGNITEDEADQEKREAAERRAKNIRDRQQIIEAEFSLHKRNHGEGEEGGRSASEVAQESSDSTTAEPVFKRTFQGFVFAFGFSNVTDDGSSIGDRYKVAGSRFFEIGHQWSTGLTSTNYLRMVYGLNFQFNGLKPIDNQYFMRSEEEVELKPFEGDLKKAKLRMDNMVVPLYLEFGPTRANGHPYKFRMGVGGYAGINLNTIQKLKFREDGHKRKTKHHFNSRTEDFVYGLGAYIGYGSTSLYVKYDLNPIFKNDAIRGNIIALGIRIY